MTSHRPGTTATTRRFRPSLEVDEGEEVVLETRDAVDGQLASDATVDDLPNFDADLVHPLTGPVFVKGIIYQG